MNKKGFTLIELIGIIMILALIFCISFPTLLNTIRSSEDTEYEQVEKDLCLAGEQYIQANIDEFDIVPDNKITISIATLIDYGTVASDTINPKTKKSVEEDELEFTVLEDKTLECKLGE